MGRLSGFHYPDVVRRIGGFRFEFYANAAGSHEIWRNPSTGQFTTIPHHSGDLPEGTLRAILRQAGIEPDQFLNQR